MPLRDHRTAVGDMKNDPIAKFPFVITSHKVTPSLYKERAPILPIVTMGVPPIVQALAPYPLAGCCAVIELVSRALSIGDMELSCPQGQKNNTKVLWTKVSCVMMYTENTEREEG